MTFIRIPGEPRFLVQSRTHPDQCYIVDLAYQPEPWSKPRLACGCPKGLQDLPCVHVKLIRKVVKL